MRWFRRVDEREVHAGHVWRVVVAEFEAPDGQRFERDVVRSPGAVAVVPLLFDGGDAPSVRLVEQYRPAYEADLIEIPAGMRDVPGEPLADTARRELAEEAGLGAQRLDHLVDVYPSPGLTDSVTSVFVATGCTEVQREAHGPEEEHMRILDVPLAEALTMIDRGTITDAKTVVGLLAVDRRLRLEHGTTGGGE